MNMLDVKDLLCTYRGELIDLCLYFYNSVKDESYEQQVESFQVLCEEYGSIKSNETVVLKNTISERELDILTDQYGEYVNQVLNSLLKKSYNEGYSSHQFYHNLWAAFINGGIVTAEKEYAFAIYYIIIDKKIPYFVLEQGLRMDDQTFDNYMLVSQNVVAKLRFILNHGFTQKTEEASLIVQELTKLDTFEEQVIAMVAILSTMRDDQKRLKKFLDRIMDGQ